MFWSVFNICGYLFEDDDFVFCVKMVVRGIYDDEMLFFLIINVLYDDEFIFNNYLIVCDCDFFYYK